MGDRFTADPPSAGSAEPPWLSTAVLERLEQIERGHRQAFGRPVLPEDSARSLRLLAQELFAAPEVLLAHDGADPRLDPGPRLIYANRAALQLWRRTWAEMVGMPSRLTAEPHERPARSQALTQALGSGGIRGYGGVRIDSQGRRFQIRGARIWSLIAADGAICGQAAAFENWWWL
jgi:hypothetical protein